MPNPPFHPSAADGQWMDAALRLARRGCGTTSPNPMVGAVLVRGGRLLGQGWHRRAGEPHAEINAMQDARAAGHHLRGATLYVTLEPCCTHGRTPPCTDAILAGQITRVVAATVDPNPAHSGRGLDCLRAAGLRVDVGVREADANRLNEAFNHWIVQRTPWVTVKAALSLDGKIATASGESKWITSPGSRAFAMRLRQSADAILVGVNTVLLDDPKLTVRRGERETGQRLRRVVLDARGRTPPLARILTDGNPGLTTIVVSADAPQRRVAKLSQRAEVLVAPAKRGKIDLPWLLARLGAQSVTSLLVEGGGEVNASFLLGGFAQRLVFFYAPKILGGRAAPGAVGGEGIASLAGALPLTEIKWRRIGADLLLTARVGPTHAR